MPTLLKLFDRTALALCVLMAATPILAVAVSPAIY
jgi:hypothetical protein